MFFNTRLVVGGVTALGIGIPCYFFLGGGGCLNSYISIPWNSGLGFADSILDCKGDNGKDYSVYLVLKKEKTTNSKSLATFKVVNNTTKKVMWGPESDEKEKWDKWGIEIIYENSGTTALNAQEAQKKITKIRIPTKKIYHQKNERIVCQKSMVQMKRERAGNCKGTFLSSKDMNFELTGYCEKRLFGGKTCNINLPKKFEWNAGFKPKAILCNS